MPDDSEVEGELRTYHRLFQHAEQQARSIQLLRAAARVMETMQSFNPYLSGPVLERTAGCYTEIDIQLFVDSAKAVSYTHLDVYKRQALGCGCCTPSSIR